MNTYSLSSHRCALALLVFVLASGCASARAPATQCPKPAGVAVRYEVLDTRGQQDVTPAVDPSRQARPDDRKPAPDLSKVRVTEASFHQQPNVRVTWVVETADAVIIGVAISSYCDGAAPETPLLRVTLPVSSKPIRWQECHVGPGCSGPRPP